LLPLSLKSKKLATVIAPLAVNLPQLVVGTNGVFVLFVPISITRTEFAAKGRLLKLPVNVGSIEVRFVVPIKVDGVPVSLYRLPEIVIAVEFVFTISMTVPYFLGSTSP